MKSKKILLIANIIVFLLLCLVLHFSKKNSFMEKQENIDRATDSSVVISVPAKEIQEVQNTNNEKNLHMKI